MRRSPAVGVVLLAVLMGAVVVLVGGWQVYKRVSAPSALPPPDGPWPRTGGITVFLCAEDSVFPVCAKKAYTKAQRQAVEAALRARPAVSDVEFRSQKEDSVRARLKPGDWTPLVAELKKLPGVSNVIAMKTPFWVGKADVGVGLCHVRTPAEKALEKSVGFKPRSCVGHDGYPSDDERQAILERILTVPGVEKVYYEDLDHARRVYEYTTGEQPLSFVSGAFLIRFAGRPDDQAVDRGVEAVKKAVEGLPGVEGVAAIRD